MLLSSACLAEEDMEFVDANGATGYYVDVASISFESDDIANARIAVIKANQNRRYIYAARFYRQLSGGAEQVGISYRSDLSEAPLQELLKRSSAKDRMMGFTTCGVQRDDFIFTMGGDPIRKVGSQGQQKSFLISLKFAQYELMKDSYGFPPALLLDDLFDKLDLKRTGNLLKMVASDEFGQIFSSDTDSSRLQGIIGGITQETTYYEAKGGVFTRQ